MIDNFRIDIGSWMVARFPFNAEAEEELSIQPGQRVLVLTNFEDGWIQVQDEQGRQGVVPKEYLTSPSQSPIRSGSSDPVARLSSNDEAQGILTHLNTYPSTRNTFAVTQNPLFKKKSTSNSSIMSDSRQSTISDLSDHRASLDSLNISEMAISDSGPAEITPYPSPAKSIQPSQSLDVASNASIESSSSNPKVTANIAQILAGKLSINSPSSVKSPASEDKNGGTGFITEVRKPTEQSAIVAMLIANKQQKQQSQRLDASMEGLADITSKKGPQTSKTDPEVGGLAAAIAAKAAARLAKEKQDETKLLDPETKSKPKPIIDGSKSESKATLQEPAAATIAILKPPAGSASLVGASSIIAANMSNRQPFGDGLSQESNGLSSKTVHSVGILAGRPALTLAPSPRGNAATSEAKDRPAVQLTSSVASSSSTAPMSQSEDWMLAATASVKKSLFKVVENKDISNVMKQNDEWFSNMMASQRQSYKSLAESVDVADKRVTEAVTAADLLVRKLASYKNIRR